VRRKKGSRLLFTLYVRASISIGILKITIEKIYSYFNYSFFYISHSTDFLFYLNIILCEKECEEKKNSL
jgi:hypothetical protein